MADYWETDATCAICGQQGHFLMRIDTESGYGALSLDGRYEERYSDGRSHKLQECEGCGYVARDISLPVDPLVLKGWEDPAYQDQLTSPDFPPPANRYLCRALLDEWADQVYEAVWNTLLAVWVCDDLRPGDAARVCRLRAVSLLQTATQRGLFGERTSDWEAIRVDLWRRAECFSEAEEFALQLLDRRPYIERRIRRILTFELRLITACDAKPYPPREVYQSP